MRLSAPIYVLKQRARALSRRLDIPLNQALDRIAQTEGYDRWSLLTARNPKVERLLDALTPGDLTILAARPRQGKTMLCLDLLVRTIRAGGRGAFFTLAYSPSELEDRVAALDLDPPMLERLTAESLVGLTAGDVIRGLRDEPRGTIAIVDYLQGLGPDAERPALRNQVEALRRFAAASGVIIVVISQVDPSYDQAGRSLPTLRDLHLPDPVDLDDFSKACFLHEGRMRISTVG